MLVLLFGGMYAEARVREDQVYELPAFVITGSQTGPGWRYAKTDGFEILSECSAAETQQVIEALVRSQVLTVPREFRTAPATPLAVILFNRKSTDNGVRPFGSVWRPGEKSTHWTNLIKRVAPDREFFCANLWGRTFTYSATFRIYMRSMLDLRTPAPPPWMQAGLFGPYGIYDERINYRPETGLVEISEAAWCSTEELRAAQELWAALQKREKIPEGKRPKELRFDFKRISPLGTYLTPLDRIWTHARLSETAGEPDLRWAATCALFVRWAMFAEGGRHAPAFWRFAEEACSHPVTEAKFREYFGFGFDEAMVKISWFFPQAAAEHPFFKVGPIVLPQVILRPASGAEIARIEGDWERVEASGLAGRLPETSQRYREQAGRLLRQACENNPEDAELAAVLGLYEYEVGDRSKAEQLLERATQSDTTRPLAWLRLGDLRLQNARARPEGHNGRLTSGQVATVLPPLLEARRLEPAMIGTYDLLLETWERFEGAPTRENLAVLREGARLFPRDTEFIYRTAALHARFSYRSEASELGVRGLEFAEDPVLAAKLRELQ